MIVRSVEIVASPGWSGAGKSPEQGVGMRAAALQHQECAPSAGSPSRAVTLPGSSVWSLLLHLVFGEEPNWLIVLMGCERQDGVLLQSS